MDERWIKFIKKNNKDNLLDNITIRKLKSQKIDQEEIDFILNSKEKFLNLKREESVQSSEDSLSDELT